MAQQKLKEDDIPKLKEKDLKEIRESFDTFDLNKDGTICITELQKALLSCGMDVTKAETHDILQSFDTNRNGVIDFDEFLLLLGKKHVQNISEEELVTSFRVFDQERKGSLSRKDFKEVMTTMGETMTEEEVDCMMETADTNKNGTIEYEEFVALMMQ